MVGTVDRGGLIRWKFVGMAALRGFEADRTFLDEIVEIKGQRVLGGFGQEFTDGKRMVDRAFETHFPRAKVVFLNRPFVLIH